MDTSTSDDGPEPARAHAAPIGHEPHAPGHALNAATPSPMALALEAARAAGAAGEVPVGAVVVASDGAVLGVAGNAIRARHDPTAHAEVLALRAACELRADHRLPDADLYVTLEPCAMCAGAIVLARIRRVYFGAYDPKGGAVEHGPCLFNQPTSNHRPEVYGGIDERACAALLRAFFHHRR